MIGTVAATREARRPGWPGHPPTYDHLVPDRDDILGLFMRPTRPALLAMAATLLAADQTLLHAGESIWIAGPLDETAHLLTGALVLAALRDIADRPFAAGLLAASVLVDVDHVPGELGLDWITRGTARPYTHSLLTLAVVGVAAFAWRSRRRLLLGVVLGIAFHFLRDTSESAGSGVSLLWPASYHSYTEPHWIYLTIVAAVLAVALARARDRRPSVMAVPAADPASSS
jgi:membrane-bound metal-dependent hydrolase YbcI (DUF457 family)